MDRAQVLYVSPIRALLNNQQERLARYFRLVGRRCCLLARGHAPVGERGGSSPIRPTACSPRPNRSKSSWFPPRSTTGISSSHVRVVVIDELHAFAGDDRGWHLLSVLSRIQRLSGT